jgi:hypothetical protein
LLPGNPINVIDFLILARYADKQNRSVEILKFNTHTVNSVIFGLWTTGTQTEQSQRLWLYTYTEVPLFELKAVGLQKPISYVSNEETLNRILGSEHQNLLDELKTLQQPKPYLFKEDQIEPSAVGNLERFLDS